MLIFKKKKTNVFVWIQESIWEPLEVSKTRYLHGKLCNYPSKIMVAQCMVKEMKVKTYELNLWCGYFYELIKKELL